MTSVAVMVDDFLRLGLIQRQIVHSRPRRYVVEFDGTCVDVIGRDDEICVVCELDELVVGVERLEVGGCDSVRRWSETKLVQCWLISISLTTQHHYTQYGVCARRRTTPASCTLKTPQWPH